MAEGFRYLRRDSGPARRDDRQQRPAQSLLALRHGALAQELHRLAAESPCDRRAISEKQPATSLHRQHHRRQMNAPHEMIESLHEHLAVCQELLQATEQEGQSLRRSDKPSLMEFYQRKK